MMKPETDIDIDLADRDAALELIEHIPALNKDNETKHNVGVYLQNIPYNPVLGTASMNFSEAEDLGYFKIDMLNNSIYEKVRDEDHLDQLVDKEPVWDLLEHKEIVQELVHIHDYFDIVDQMKPKNIDQLAMVLAMIRPAKRYLVGKGWKKIEKEIWKAPTDGSYYFKKSHSYAYAMSIIVQLNLITEQASKK